MEESLMDHKMLRRLVLEQKLVDYVYANELDKIPRYFDCGPEFGLVRLYYKGGWRVEWDRGTWNVYVEECPVDLNGLPKQGE